MRDRPCGLCCAARPGSLTGRSSPSPPRASRSPHAPIPPRLAPNPLLPAEIALEAARRCDFIISGGGSAPFAVNGATFVDWSPKPAYRAPARRARRVRARQQDGGRAGDAPLGPCRAHPASMDDGWEPYWRDTLLIQPGRTAHIAFVADNPGKWPLESVDPRTSRGRRRDMVSGRLTSLPQARAQPA